MEIDFTQQMVSPPELGPAEPASLSYPPIENPVIDPSSPVKYTGTDISKYYFSVEGARPIYDYTPYGDTTSTSNDFFVDIQIRVGCPTKDVLITKRIKMCKSSLATEAEAKDGELRSTATFVESKESNKLLNQRMLELAGVSHSKNFV